MTKRKGPQGMDDIGSRLDWLFRQTVMDYDGGGIGLWHPIPVPRVEPITEGVEDERDRKVQSDKRVRSRG